MGSGVNQNDVTVKHQRHITKTLVRDYGEDITLMRQRPGKRSPGGQIVKTDRSRSARPEQKIAFFGVRDDLVRTISAEGGKILLLKWNLVGLIGTDVKPGDTFDLYSTTYFVHEVVPDQRWEVRAWVREYGDDAVEA